MIIEVNLSGVATLVLLFNLLLVIAVVFVERKDPVTTLSWVLVMTFLPLVGTVLYLFFGRGLKIPTRRRLAQRHRFNQELEQLINQYDKEYEELMRRVEQGEAVPRDPAAKKYAPLVKMNATQAASRLTGGNRVEIYTDAARKYRALLQDIQGAKTSVHLLYFIFQNDEIGRKIIDALAKKAAEGLEVRCCYDDLGSITTSSWAFDPLRRAGGKVYRFFRLTPLTLFRANYRNHRKIVVIDGRIAYTGGMNIGNEYMGLHPRKRPWRDTHLRLTGPCVHDLQALFLNDWYYATRGKRLTDDKHMALFFPKIEESPDGVELQVVSSGPDTEGEQIKRALMRLFGQARRSILIQTPYFIPDQAFLECLQTAAQAGVAVTVMIPGVADKRTVYAVTRSYLRDLLDHGVRVLRHPGFLHAKMVVVDEEIASIGTCNMDMRSFRLHFEVNEFFYDSALARKCARIFREDADCCDEITMEVYSRRSRPQRIIERIGRLCAPLL